MISHQQMRQAARARALTLSVATTGSITLGATATGYTRATGSFLTDGFALGMELTAAGFTPAGDNGTAVILGVSALLVTVNRALTVAAPAAARSLVVGLPAGRSWENVAFTPTTGAPYVEEQYSPGPQSKVTIGPLGELEAAPLYHLLVNVPSGTGPEAAFAYADGLLAHFAVGTAMTLANGDVLRVRGDTGPYPTQLMQGNPGFAVVPVTIPMRLRTQNSI